MGHPALDWHKGTEASGGRWAAKSRHQPGQGRVRWQGLRSLAFGRALPTHTSQPWRTPSPSPAQPTAQRTGRPWTSCGTYCGTERAGAALRSFPAATAPGPSGLRVQHIHEALQPGAGDGLMDQLAAVVNLLVQGRACSNIAPFLAGASLVALPKPNGGVRPIAIGEVLRRLTSKSLMQLVQKDAQAHFWPAQAGVAVKAGVEAAVHTLRAWVHRHASATDQVVVKLDFCNAFNTVKREAVLQQARDHFPALARWATWCYSTESRLQFGDFVLGSSTGVQQGDPLGPLLFAAALQPLAEELRSSPLDLSLFYLDDGILAGNVASVGAALTRVQAAAADIGLSLNLRKSEVILVGRTPPSCLQGHLSQELLTDSSGHCRVLQDFEFLGAGIGSTSFMERHASQRVASAQQLLEAIGSLEDPQVALRLLRACGSFARLLHTMRCCPPSGQPQALAHFDTLVQQCFSAFTGIHCSPGQWAQAARGLGLAGLGLRSTLAHAPAAYLASVGACDAQCRDLDPAYPTDLTASPHVLTAVHTLNACRLLDQASWEAQVAVSSAVERASLVSEGDVGGRAFLAAVPHGAKKMEPAVFLAELRVRLQVAEAAEDTWCPKCDAVLDTLSHHAAVCLAGGVWLAVNAFRGIMPCVTCSALRPTGLDSAQRRRRQAFFFLNTLMTTQQPTAGLPTCSSLPSKVPQLHLTSPLRHSSGWTHWLKQDELRGQLPRPTTMWRGNISRPPSCVPLRTCTFSLWSPSTGTWCPDASKVLRQIARAAALRSGEDCGLAQAHLFQEACVALRATAPEQLSAAVPSCASLLSEPDLFLAFLPAALGQAFCLLTWAPTPCL